MFSRIEFTWLNGKPEDWEVILHLGLITYNDFYIQPSSLYIIRCTDNLGHFIEMRLEGGFKMGRDGKIEGYNVISVKRNLHHETGLGRGHRKPIDMASITSGNVEDLYCYFLNRKMGFCSLKSCKHFQGCNAASKKSHS